MQERAGLLAELAHYRERVEYHEGAITSASTAMAQILRDSRARGFDAPAGEADNSAEGARMTDDGGPLS